MTRQEFIDEIADFYDLREFANDNEFYDLIDDLLTDDEIDEDVNYELPELVRDESWQTVRDILNDVPRHSGWFIRTGYLSYEGAYDDDFESLKRQVLEAADEHNVWDEEEAGELEQGDDYDPDSVMLALFGVKAS